MRSLLPLMVLFPMIASAQIPKEALPSYDDQLSVSTDIETSTEIEAPRMQGTLQGLAENLPAARTPESVFEEVLQHQSRLTHTYKAWKIREADGVGPRTFGLSLTINSSGDVEKVFVKGPTNTEFLAEVEAIIRTWTFSKVKAGKPYQANLKNLDFLYRRNLVLE